MDDTSDPVGLAKHCVDVWAPGARVSVLRDLRGGRSGARVLLVDIAPASAHDLRSGQYVLKISDSALWPGEEPESARHSIAETRNPDFSKSHIPKLVKGTVGKDQIALLYEIAALSFSNVVTADTLDAGALPRHCRDVSLALLAEFNASYTIDTNTTALETVQQWLGYRLARDQAPTLHRFIEAQCGRQPGFPGAGRVLVNPLWLVSQPTLAAAALSVRFSGLLHGDLHPGNLLIDRRRPDSTDFWLIDFALSRMGPLGFDHAYLEVALLLTMLQGAPPERLLSMVEALDADEGTPQALRVAVQDVGLLTSLRALRRGASEWQEAKYLIP